MRKSLSMGRFVLAMILFSLAIGGYGAYSAYLFFKVEFPDVHSLRTQFPIVHYHGKKEPFTVSMSSKRPARWAAIGEISRHAIGAVIVSEDWAFYQHKGYDPAQIKEAIVTDFERGYFARGASTITQQVVKNVFLTSEKSIWRKLKEVYLAVKLEEAVGKRRILETYLNIAEWGEGIFGIRAASHHYFDKSPSQLSPKEAAFLAMLLPSPKRYSQSFRAKKMTPYARVRVRSILKKMMQAGYLSPEQRASFGQIPLSFEVTPESSLSGSEVPVMKGVPAESASDEAADDSGALPEEETATEEPAEEPDDTGEAPARAPGTQRSA